MAKIKEKLIEIMEYWEERGKYKWNIGIQLKSFQD